MFLDDEDHADDDDEDGDRVEDDHVSWYGLY